jgi:hypothetical protein
VEAVIPFSEAELRWMIKQTLEERFNRRVRGVLTEVEVRLLYKKLKAHRDLMREMLRRAAK